MYTRRYRDKIRMVILDTAGTVCDGPQDLRHRWPEDDLRGCKAPVVPFYKVLKSRGVTLDWAAIREPMGLYKPDHLRLLLDRYANRFIEANGHPYTEDDFAAMLDEFKTLLTVYSVDDDLSRPVAGAAEAIVRLREAAVLVGCDTGYFDATSRLLNDKLAGQYGLYFDVNSNAELSGGRPSPGMIFDCMVKARVWPADAVVKVDDTAAGILSGNSAGCWTIGLFQSGSDDYDKLAAAQPDFLVPNIVHVPDIVFAEIEPRLRRGARPGD